MNARANAGLLMMTLVLSAVPCFASEMKGTTGGGRPFEMKGAVTSFVRSADGKMGIEQTPLFLGWPAVFRKFDKCSGGISFVLQVDSLLGGDTIISMTTGIPIPMSINNGEISMGEPVVCGDGMVLRLRKGMSFSVEGKEYKATTDSCGIAYTADGAKTFGIVPAYPDVPKIAKPSKARKAGKSK